MLIIYALNSRVEIPAGLQFPLCILPGFRFCIKAVLFTDATAISAIATMRMIPNHYTKLLHCSLPFLGGFPPAVLDDDCSTKLDLLLDKAINALLSNPS